MSDPVETVTETVTEAATSIARTCGCNPLVIGGVFVGAMILSAGSVLWFRRSKKTNEVPTDTAAANTASAAAA